MIQAIKDATADEFTPSSRTPKSRGESVACQAIAGP